jgi:hypothetical protein
MKKDCPQTIMIDETKYVRADSVAEAKALKAKDFSSLRELIGMNLFIRTVTYHSVGQVVGIVDGFLVLAGASWVADSGRFMNALRDGTLNEVEPVGGMLVAVSAIVDIFPWKHSLPTVQK